MPLALEHPQSIALHRPAKPLATQHGPWTVDALQDLLDLLLMDRVYRLMLHGRRQFNFFMVTSGW